MSYIKQLKVLSTEVDKGLINALKNEFQVTFRSLAFCQSLIFEGKEPGFEATFLPSTVLATEEEIIVLSFEFDQPWCVETSGNECTISSHRVTSVGTSIGCAITPSVK